MVVERQKKVIWINLWRDPKDLLNPLFSSEISFEKGGDIRSTISP